MPTLSVTPQTLAVMRQHWEAYRPFLDAQFERLCLSLVAAESIEQIRILQGRARENRALVKLPDHLAAQLAETQAEENGAK